MAGDDDARTGTDDNDNDQNDQSSRSDQAARPGSGTDGTDWKAEARKWEKRAKEQAAQAKEHADAARRLKEIEDADKSEVERLTERIAVAEQHAKDAEARALRAEVAHEKNLTPAQAKRLSGATKEELEADAAELLEAFSAKQSSDGDGDGDSDGDSGKDRGRRPKEKLRPGAVSPDTEKPPDAAKLAKSILDNPF